MIYHFFNLLLSNGPDTTLKSLTYGMIPIDSENCECKLCNPNLEKNDYETEIHNSVTIMRNISWSAVL